MSPPPPCVLRLVYLENDLADTMTELLNKTVRKLKKKTHKINILGGVLWTDFAFEISACKLWE